MNESTQSKGGAWPAGIAAITLFEEDLETAKRFYQQVFRLPVFFEDENSAVFKFGDTLVNLLNVSEAPELVKPAKAATEDAGVRFQFTLEVDDVDAMCEELRVRSTGRGESAPRAFATPAGTSGRLPSESFADHSRLGQCSRMSPEPRPSVSGIRRESGCCASVRE
jgi:predicted enzyme related to lactoylglutathione lyase